MRDIGPLVGAIDQGTSSTRFIVFSAADGSVITYHQIEVKRYYPRDGWVEQNPIELFDSVIETANVVCEKLRQLEIDPAAIRCIGLTNQRESAIVWDRITGNPLYNCIVWMDNRTADIVDSMLDNIPGREVNWLKKKTGLPLSTYFTAFKLKWLLANDGEVRRALADGRLLFGTVDSWLLWKLTGGLHATDVTNACRTMLMNIETLEWDADLCRFFDIPLSILPAIRPSGSFFGTITIGAFANVPITGVIGDQNAALVGQQCFGIGQAKVTYGTGCFLIQNIGPAPLHAALAAVSREAKQSLLVTVAYQFADHAPCYALEGSIAIAGAAVTWLRDNLELIQNYAEIERIARQDQDSGGLFFVPALQGLYAPYWDANATGTIIGLSQSSKKCHVVRATLEGVAFQANDILAMMMTESPGPVKSGPQDNDDFGDDDDNGQKSIPNAIKVDGGMSSNDLLCQFLADISGRRIIRPRLTEATALGAAIVAGYTAKLWPQLADMINGNNNNNNNHENQTKKTTLLRQITRRISASLANHYFDDHRKSAKQEEEGESDDDDDDEEEKVANKSPETKTIFEQTFDTFEPTLDEAERLSRIETWRMAVDRSRKWIRVETQEQRKLHYNRLSALPFMLFVMLSFGTHILSAVQREI